MTDEEQTLYESVGGDATFQKLVDVFYSKVETDVPLRSFTRVRMGSPI